MKVRSRLTVLRLLTAATTVAIGLGCLVGPATGWAFFGHKRSSWEQFTIHQSILSTVDKKKFQKELKRLLRNKRQLRQLGERAEPYLQHIIKETTQQQIPAELALLPMVESRFQPFSFSQTGATGLWQMMPGTASGYGLTIDWWYDARRDTIDSTRAALSYLNYLHNYFRDWLLAIAAYNAGEGRILRAIHENMKKHLPITYWSLRLPKQTREYVPLFLAYVEIFSHPKKYQLGIKPLTDTMAWEKFSLPGPMHLSQVASMAGISVATLRAYNPGFLRDVTGPHYHSLLIPKYAAKAMKSQLIGLKKGTKSLTEWTHYTVKRGDTLSQIAKKNHTTTNLIKYVNHLKSNQLNVHQNLYIPAHKKKLAVPISKKRGKIRIDAAVVSESKLPGPKQLHYLVKKGDTRIRIARKFHVKESQLVYWNGLNWNAPLIPGQRLNLWRKSYTSRHHKPIAHKVRSGESLSSLATRYHTSIKKIKRQNNLSSNTIKVGERLWF
jgi:membrane-bound lytic murein transglycosylase D